MSRRPPLALPFSLTLALRYLRSTRRDAFVTFLSTVAAGGLALGVAALILSLAALAGFHDVLLGEVRARTPDLEVMGAAPEPEEAVRRAVAEHPQVRFSQWLVEGRGWLISAGRIRPVRVTGFEERLPASFATQAPEIGAGVYVSERLATLWGLRAGQVVEVASNLPTLTPFGPQPRVRRMEVAGIYGAGRTEEEERIAVPLPQAQSLFGNPEKRLEVEAAPGASIQGLARRLREALPPGAEVATWRELNRPLLFALRLEKTLLFVAVSLIALVAALALIADLALIVSNKRPELGMLATSGATPRQLRRAFLWLGGLLALAAAAIGTLGGVTAALWLDHARLLKLTGDVYFIDYVPFRVRPGEVAQVLAVAAALAMGGAWFVARRAAALDPVEALRR